MKLPSGTRRGLARSAAIALACVVGGSIARGQGVIAPTAGPINSAMGGASTAAPIEFGSSYWNPATLSGLPRQEFLLGSQLLIPSIHLSSSIRAGAINGVFPPQSRSGTARSDSGVPSNLATGVAFRLSDDSPITFGFGVFGLVGGGVNYAGTNGVPILTPRRPDRFFGVGPIYANATLLSIIPSASAQVTEKLALAFSPVITSGTVQMNPAFFAPGPRDRFGLPTFPAATNIAPFWGAGFQLGALYSVNSDWNLGFSYKSPVWQERWKFNSATPDLDGRRIGLQAQLPAILSWGIAYKGIERTLIDVDMRYFDYANTSLYGDKVVNGGLAWRSIFAVAAGAQYAWSDRMTLRAGYLYNQNPIRDVTTLFNVQVPGITTNTMSFGASYQLTPNIVLSAAWVHAFLNSIEGPILQVPGTSVKTDVQVDSLVMGLNIQFGGSKPTNASLAQARDNKE